MAKKKPVNTEAEAKRERDKRFGRRLAELRHARGFTQAELAKWSGVSLSYITELESGRRLLTATGLETAMNIAEVLKVNVAELLKEPENAEKPAKGRPRVE